MTDPAQPSPGSTRALATALASRVAALEDAATAAVEGIGHDRAALVAPGAAEESTDELIRTVVERVEAMAAESRRLAYILGRFESLAAKRPGGAATPAGSQPTERIVENPSRDNRAPAGRDRGAGPRVSEGIRLLATQMSVAGASNDEIATRLRDDFGVEDSDRLVDSLFGTASG